MVLNLLGRRPKPDGEVVARIKQWSRAALRAGEETSFAVNEIICNDPACPGTETVILVMQPGARTVALKVPNAMADVAETDVVTAVAAQADR